MELAKRIGTRVRHLRTQQGLTIEQLAHVSGIPPESISRVERGRSTASLRTLERLSKGLGLQLSTLLDSVTVETVNAEGIPAEARGVALLLAGQSPKTIAHARSLIEVLLEATRQPSPEPDKSS